MKTFISSTFVDLEAHRAAAADALERLGQQVGRMEVFGARPQEPVEACLEEIEACDAFVGIYAHRYGFMPANSDISITEQEYDYAVEHHKTIFCFVVDENHPWLPKHIEGEPGRSKLVALRRKVGVALVTDTFTTPDDLAFKVAASVGRYIAWRDREKGPDGPYWQELRSRGDLPEMLEHAVRLLEQATETDYNQVFLASTSAYASELVTVAQIIPGHKQAYRIAAFGSLLGISFNSSKTICANHVREHPGYFQAVLQTQSQLVVPIVSQHAVVGVLNSESEQPGHYVPNIVKSVEKLASAIGAVLPLYAWSPGTLRDNLPWIRRAPYGTTETERQATQGTWQCLPYCSEVMPIHAAILNTGKVLFFNVSQDAITSVVWDPMSASSDSFFHPPTLRLSGASREDNSPPPRGGGATFLADGRLLCVADNHVAVFDPGDQCWSAIDSMANRRWCTTPITLGDGRVLATNGLTEDLTGPHSTSLQIYDPSGDVWRRLDFDPAFPGLPLYGHLFLLADGRILFDGGRMYDDLPVGPCIIDLSQQPVKTIPVSGMGGRSMRDQSASVLLPPAQDQRVMVMGGSLAGRFRQYEAVDDVHIVDLNDPTPYFVPASRLNFPRLPVNAVLLPDHTVFVSGGFIFEEQGPLPLMNPEIYDPATNTWLPMAASTLPRIHNSTALLLPDGSVVAAGGSIDDLSMDKRDKHRRQETPLEIFRPPYFFKGARPTIAQAPRESIHGQTIDIKCSESATLCWVTLLKNCVMTHSFDGGQRLVDLVIKCRDEETISAKVPANPNIAPPGWYMLFVVNNSRVPSIGRWIHLSAS